MEIARRQLGENTRAVHLPPPPDTAQRPLGTPVYRTAGFAFSSAQEYAAVLNDQVPGYSYSRIDNPTVDAFARAVAALEGANLQRWPAAQAFASGMAAISGVFLAFARAGAHVVASAAVYGGTYSLLRNVLSRFGVETDFVDITDLDAVSARHAARDADRLRGDDRQPDDRGGRPQAARRDRPRARGAARHRLDARPAGDLPAA